MALLYWYRFKSSLPAMQLFHDGSFVIAGTWYPGTYYLLLLVPGGYIKSIHSSSACSQGIPVCLYINKYLVWSGVLVVPDMEYEQTIMVYTYILVYCRPL